MDLVILQCLKVTLCMSITNRDLDVRCKTQSLAVGARSFA